MNQIIVAVIGFSLAIPAVLGLCRLRKIDRAYYPFLALLWVGVINEIISKLLINAGQSNLLTGNIYVLVEGLILVYQFKRWQLFSHQPKLYPALNAALLISWTIEIYLRKPTEAFASFYLIFYSLCITLLSISMINKLVVNENKLLLKNAMVLLCFAFVVYYTAAMVVELTYLYGTFFSNVFATAVIRIMDFVNLLTNTLFVIAIIWMPRKQRFSVSF